MCHTFINNTQKLYVLVSYFRTTKHNAESNYEYTKLFPKKGVDTQQRCSRHVLCTYKSPEKHHNDLNTTMHCFQE